MSNFGSYNEQPTFVNKLLVGKTKWQVLAVNPTLGQLKSMKDQGLNVFVPTEEPVYIGKAPATFNAPTETPYFDTRFILKSLVPGHEDLISQISYRVFNTPEVSANTGKHKVINLYGATTWIEESELKAGVLPAKMDFYIKDGMRSCLRGEENVIKLIRSLLNMPVVNNPTVDPVTGKMRKGVDVDKRPQFASQFNKQMFDEMFAGKFTSLQAIISDAYSKGASVALLAGVRTTTNDEGVTKQYQSFYGDEPQRAFWFDGNKTESSDNFIVKRLEDAVSNGRFSNVYFGVHNLKPREYTEAEAKGGSTNGTAAPASDPFGSSVPSSNPFGAPAMNNSPFPPAPDFGSQEDPDDLPF